MKDAKNLKLEHQSGKKKKNLTKLSFLVEGNPNQFPFKAKSLETNANISSIQGGKKTLDFKFQSNGSGKQKAKSEGH